MGEGERRSGDDREEVYGHTGSQAQGVHDQSSVCVCVCVCVCVSEREEEEKCVAIPAPNLLPQKPDSFTSLRPNSGCCHAISSSLVHDICCVYARSEVMAMWSSRH